MAKHKHQKFPVCPNCAHTFNGPDNFCPNCGQENHNLNVPFKHILLELLEGTFHFDTKIFRTVKLLLLKPGELTRLFIDNRRADYVPPIRLYIFISFIFFLVMATDFGHKKQNPARQTAGVFFSEDEVKQSENQLISQESTNKARPVTNKGRFSLNKIDLEILSDSRNVKETDQILQKSGFQITDFNRSAAHRIGRFFTASNSEKSHKFYKITSLLMFILMPFFGLMLKGAYFRQNRHYIQHLIFSIHFHCFLFLVLLIATGLNTFTQSGWIISGILAICTCYLFSALHRLFKQSRLRTLVKTIFIQISYAFTLVVALLLAVVLSIAFF